MARSGRSGRSSFTAKDIIIGHARWKLAHTAYSGQNSRYTVSKSKSRAEFIYTYVDCDRKDRLSKRSFTVFRCLKPS